MGTLYYIKLCEYRSEPQKPSYHLPFPDDNYKLQMLGIKHVPQLEITIIDLCPLQISISTFIIPIKAYRPSHVPESQRNYNLLVTHLANDGRLPHQVCTVAVHRLYARLASVVCGSLLLLMTHGTITGTTGTGSGWGDNI